MSTCEACGKPIVWLRTPHRVPIAVDAETEKAVVTVTGVVVKGRTPHAATCPAANERLDQLALKGVQ